MVERYDPYTETRPLHTRRRGVVVRPIEDEPALFQEHEVTFFDTNSGAQTIEEGTVHLLGCGHYAGLRSPAEMIARCGWKDCGNKLCFRCGNLRCRRCLRILCQEHARLVDSFTIYCPRCRLIELGKRYSVGSLSKLRSLLAAEDT